MNRITNFLALLCLLCSCSEMPAAQTEVYISTEVAEDATTALYDLLIDGGAVENTTIHFEKGVYHFYPEMAYEQFCNISNHNDVLARIAMPIIGANNLTIDGGGSKLIIHGRMIPFWVEGSNNVKVTNLTVDYADTFHSEGTVIATNSAAKTIDVKYRDEDKYEIRNGEIIFIKPYYEFPLGQTMYFDAKKKAPALRTQSYSLPVIGKTECAKPFNAKDYKYKCDKNDAYIINRGSANGVMAKEIAPQTIRYTILKDRMPPLGVVLVAKGNRGPNRFAPGVRCLNSNNLSFDSLTINHAAGMGFIMDNCENIDLYRCQVVPSEGRVISTTADATHFVGCRGKLSLRECVLQSQMDDGINVHGAYQEVQQILDENTISLRIGHFQQMGVPIAKVGDTVGVVNMEESFDPYATLTVKSIKKVNGRCYRVTFNEALPAKISDKDLIENLTAYPELTIEGCDFSRNRARAILISTPKRVVIRNNSFSTEMTPILMPVENGFWYESGSASDVLIENNTFTNCVYGGKLAPVINLTTDVKGDKIAFRNIVIRNNTFNHVDNYIISINNTDSLLFESNTINSSDAYPQLHPGAPVATVNYSRNIEFKDNHYNGVATTMIKSSHVDKPVEFK